MNITIIKKSGNTEPYNSLKIIRAAEKAAHRVLLSLSEDEKKCLIHSVEDLISSKNLTEIPVSVMHQLVELSLDSINSEIAKSYRDFRNYKKSYGEIFQTAFQKDQTSRYLGDKENANKDSALVSTKRSLSYGFFSKEIFKHFHMRRDWLSAIDDGYIYVHDLADRRDTMNCCLFDMKEVLTGGFEMANIWYNEPKTLDVAGDVIGDVVLSAASQQYGGFTVPEVDKLLEPYAKKSYENHLKDFAKIRGISISDAFSSSEADNYCMEKLGKEMEQVFQGWEYKFNTVGSSRGDYPFITMTFGLSTSRFGKLASITALKVREGGQGKPGFKRPVLFPKLVFLYDENLHGIGKKLEDVFEAGVSCSLKTMYPDWLSLSGKGYVAEIYQKYGEVISPMGCRAFLSPWYKRGGLKPADKDDAPIFIGRFNIGVVSLNLPMIYMKSQKECQDFYKILDYYLSMIRDIHRYTYDYLGELKASCNPLAFCEGGFYGGHLNYDDKIRPLLKYSTASFGYTALNELQQCYNKTSLVEDGSFALEVLGYINKKVEEFKKEDNYLYAIYGTPAENLCGAQVKQFRKLYGIIPHVSDKAYFSNSFHCHVSENITPIEKQDFEYRFWNLSNGGKIQYVKYPIDYNRNAVKTLIRRAMAMGLYEGVNLALSYCDDCAHQELDMNICPVCGSKNITKIDRMNGYLAYTQINGHSRLNDAKLKEIADRVSM